MHSINDGNDQDRGLSGLREFRLTQQLDRVGNLEEFTSDAYLILESSVTAHLNDNGLPSIGSDVYPGMCLIAKFGATEFYDRAGFPNDLEVFANDELTLIRKYCLMFYDASLYVPDAFYGLVEHAEFLENEGVKTAVVQVLPRRNCESTCA